AAVGDGFRFSLTAASEFIVRFELPSLVPLPDPMPKPAFSGDIDVGLAFARKSAAAPLVLGDAQGTHFSIGELSGGIRLKNAEPQVTFDLKDARLVLKVGDDPFLGAVIGDAI